MTFIKSYFTLLLLVFSSFLLNAQSSEIELATISSNWNSGKYQLFVVYDENGGLTMRGGKLDLEITKDKDGLISMIKYKIENSTYEFTPKFWGGSGGPLLGFKSGRNQYLYVTETGIAHYTTMGSRVDELNYMIGTKLGGSKKVKKIITDYLEGLEQLVDDREEARKAAIAAHREKYSIQGKDLKEIKVELVSSDNKIDCSSNFVIAYTAILADGTQIKSKSQGGEAYRSDFKINVVGADGENMTGNDGKTLDYKRYTVHKYCDKMDDKHLLVEVSSRHHSSISGKVRLAASCVPDPQIIAEQKAAEERRIAAEKRAKELAKKQKEAAANKSTSTASNANNNTPIKTSNVGLQIFKSSVSISEIGNWKSISDNESVSTYYKANKVIRHPAGWSVIGGYNKTTEVNRKSTYEKNAAISIGSRLTSELMNNNLGVENSYYYDAIITSDGNYIVLGYQSINVFKKKGSNEVELVSKKDLVLQTKQIVDLGNGKCAILATSNTKDAQYYGLKLLVYDYKSDKLVESDIYNGRVYEMPKIITTSDGHVAISYDEMSNDLYHTYLLKINAKKMLTTNQLEVLWKHNYDLAKNYASTDLIEDRAGNFVMAYRSKIIKEYLDNTTISYKRIEIGITKVDASGNNFHSHVIKAVDPSQWGRSTLPEANLKMNYQDKIRFSAFDVPRIIENPKGEGYLICARISYDLWQYKTIYSGHGTDVRYDHSIPRNAMYADQPTVLYIDNNSLELHSLDFIETTFSIHDGHDPIATKSTATIGQEYDITQFSYLPEDDKYLIVEQFSGGWGSYFWMFDINLKSNWNGANVASTVSRSSGSSRSSSSSSSSSSKSSSSKPQVESGKWIVKNESGSTQFIGINGQSKELKNGDEWKLSCVSDLYYYYKEGTSNKRGKLIVEGDDVCGTIYKLK